MVFCKHYGTSNSRKRYVSSVYLKLTNNSLFLETLDELEELVVNLFSSVVDKNVVVDKWLERPFTVEHLKTCVHVVPVKDIRNLNIVFPTPDLLEHYKSSVSFFFVLSLFVI